MRASRRSVTVSSMNGFSCAAALKRGLCKFLPKLFVRSHSEIRQDKQVFRSEIHVSFRLHWTQDSLKLILFEGIAKESEVVSYSSAISEVLKMSSVSRCA